MLSRVDGEVDLEEISRKPIKAKSRAGINYFLSMIFSRQVLKNLRYLIVNIDVDTHRKTSLSLCTYLFNVAFNSLHITA